MSRLIFLLRGVNLGTRNRVPMPQLRDALETLGFEDVRTYLQSGNLVLTSGTSARSAARDVEGLIAERFGVDTSVVVRTADELERVIERDPFAGVAKNPKRYQVTFLDAAPSPDAVRKLEAAATGGERVRQVGRELYAWHPNGVGRSKLAALMASKELGGTARNWATVTKLLELADE